MKASNLAQDYLGSYLAADGITAVEHKPLIDSELASDLESDRAADKITTSLAVDHKMLKVSNLTDSNLA